jgi:heptosyltransferase-2
MGSALKEAYPDSQVTWLVRPYTAPLLHLNPEVDQILLDHGQPGAVLAKQIRERAFDTAFVVYPRWRTVWAVRRAGVPERIGPANKWYSLFLSNRISQHRSKSERHEADYNLELLSAIGILPKPRPTVFVLSEEERARARRVLDGHRISADRPLAILHPGSGGSASRWPLTHFMDLGNRLAEEGVQVVVTAGQGETYQSIMVDQMRRIPVMIAAGSVTLRELGALFSHADVMVSNSTGPLHLAVSVGTPTVSVYSPITACHPRRWGPYPDFVEGQSAHRALVAPVVGGQPDMTGVSVEQVFEQCRAQWEKRRQTGVTRGQ